MTATTLNSLPTGLDRLGRYSAFTARLAARRLRRKLTGEGLKITTPDTITFMAVMKGLPQKLGQHLSMKGDLYPHYAPLLSQGHPLDDQRLLDLLQDELGQRAQAFTTPLTRVASASLAQVYRSRLDSGAQVAVKIQYPDMAQVLEDDITNLLGLAQLVARWMPSSSRSDPEALRELMTGLKLDLLRELDFRHEAHNLERMGRLFIDLPGVTCPDPITNLSSDRVLTMTWSEGVPWLDALQAATPAQRALALERLARAYLTTAWSAGLLHADPHPGNLLASGIAHPLEEITLLDFGQVLDRPARWWDALRGIIHAARVKDANLTDMARLFIELGFRAPQVQRMEPVLLPLSQAMLRPFVTPGPFDLGSWNLGKELEEILSNQPEPLQLELPPGLVMLQRTFHGLFFYALRFDVRLDWSRLVPA